MDCAFLERRRVVCVVFLNLHLCFPPADSTLLSACSHVSHTTARDR
jgi:hypothetical protein